MTNFVRCANHSSFWLAMIASTLFGFSTFIPLWLGRVKQADTRLYGLFFQMNCTQNSCTGFQKMFDNESVEGTFGFSLIFLPIGALIAAISAFLGVLLIEIIGCNCGRRVGCDPKPVIGFVVLLFWIASIFSVLGFLVSIAVCYEFYKDDPIEDAAEFPWCTMFFGIGVLLMLIATILYTRILCNWEEHGAFYGAETEYSGIGDSDDSVAISGVVNKGYQESSKVDGPSNYSESIKRGFAEASKPRESTKEGGSGYGESVKRDLRDSSKYLESTKWSTSSEESIKRSFNGSRMPLRDSAKGPIRGGMSAFMDTASLRSSSDHSSKIKDTSYFNFGVGGSKKGGHLFSKKIKSKDEIKKSIHGSPAILRHTTATSYLREERDSLRESRKIPKVRSVDEINPDRLATGRTNYRERRLDSDYISASTKSTDSKKNEENILDVLYRESKKYSK